MLDLGYGSDLYDEERQRELFRVTLVKCGPLSAEQAFAFYGATDVRGIDRGLATVIGTPSIAQNPFGYLRIDGPDLDIAMQFIDATSGLEEHLLHEDEDEDGNVIPALPDLVLVACEMRPGAYDRFFLWAHANRVPYIDLRDEIAYGSVHHGRIDA